MDPVTRLNFADLAAVLPNVILAGSVRERCDNSVTVDSGPGLVAGQVFLVRVE